MLDGWYCRSMASMRAEEQAARAGEEPSRPPDAYSSASSQGEPDLDYKAHYQTLKKKFKYLIYENECFQDALRTSQKRLLKACRDRSFLLDRLLQYEKPENTSSDTEDSDSSDDDETNRLEITKKRRIDPILASHSSSSNVTNINKNPSSVKRKRPPPQKKIIQNNLPPVSNINKSLSFASDGHMTPEEVERHLQSRQSFLELVPERAPPTVPTEMFSNDPSLDSESNDVLETSPCNIGDDWIE